jgi:hypothetical protein
VTKRRLQDAPGVFANVVRTVESLHRKPLQKLNHLSWSIVLSCGRYNGLFVRGVIYAAEELLAKGVWGMFLHPPRPPEPKSDAWLKVEGVAGGFRKDWLRTGAPWPCA